MAREQPKELFMPPNMLKAKVGSAHGGIDMGAMRRAEAALDTLKSNFSDWIADDVKSLVAVRTLYAQTPDAASRAALMRAAHDIKGQAATFHYPLIARVAASLARLISASPQNEIVPQGLVDAHVDAIHVIYRQGIQTSEDKIALTLCAELDKRVEETLSPTKKK
jgi:chemotaxis protein histidine kinase CheA